MPVVPTQAASRDSSGQGNWSFQSQGPHRMLHYVTHYAALVQPWGGIDTFSCCSGAGLQLGVTKSLQALQVRR